MTLIATGLNHQTAPVDVRERLAIDDSNGDSALDSLRARPGVHEAVLLSTCNRTELYCRVDEQAQDEPLRWLAEHHRVPESELGDYLYRHNGADAVRHLFRVATGLDSLVLGEPQILGQVKQAFQRARRLGSLGPVTDRLFQQCFATAKRVRTDTRIGAHPVSVAFAAVRLAEQAFTRIDQASILLIGAGDTIELAARHLRDRNARRLMIANRTLLHAQTLASQVGGFALPLDELGDHLAEADIVVSATASRLPVLGKEAVAAALRSRRNRPMLLLDLAVPRDIDPKVAELADVYLYSVDDLEQVIDENRRSRREAADQAEAIIELQVEHYVAWWRGSDAHELLRQLRSQAGRQSEQALEQARRQLAAGKPAEQVIEQLAHQLTNRLMHQPSSRLREAARDGDRTLIQAAERLFSESSCGSEVVVDDDR